MRRGDTATDFWFFMVSFHEARSKACTKEGPVGFVKNLDLIWNKEKECPNWPSADRKCVLSGHVAASPALSEQQVVQTFLASGLRAELPDRGIFPRSP